MSEDRFSPLAIPAFQRTCAWRQRRCQRRIMEHMAAQGTIIGRQRLHAECNQIGMYGHLARQQTRHGPYLAIDIRSEEHTSELQSLMRISYAVFCLKKKNKAKHNSNT